MKRQQERVLNAEFTNLLTQSIGDEIKTFPVASTDIANHAPRNPSNFTTENFHGKTRLREEKLESSVSCGRPGVASAHVLAKAIYLLAGEYPKLTPPQKIIRKD